MTSVPTNLMQKFRKFLRINKQEKRAEKALFSCIIIQFVVK